MQIREVPYETVAPYASLAARDHVSAKPTPTTRWWAAVTEKGVVLGFAGLLFLRDRARIKGVWVKPQERGTGLGTRITEHVINVGLQVFPRLEVFAYNPEFYEARGWKRTGMRGNASVLLCDVEVSDGA